MLLFSDVAVFFKEIEKRSGRLEMTDLLANLFKQTNEKEIDKLIYILQGILAPPYEGIELGMGERFALEAISSASGYAKSEVEKNYKKSGDLGDSAEELLDKKKQTALSTTDMEISYLFDALIKIAKSSGSGSQDLKIKILTELLNNSSGLESRYIIRYVTGSLRLGVGDPTILDALSVAHAGDKSLREKLERAYNTCSDLGHVAKIFYQDPKKIEKFVVTPFKPLMPALAERENSPGAIIERLGKCGIEMKYDGLRLQCHKKDDNVEIYSRKLEKMTRMFPDIVEAILKLKAKEIIFEGEALAFDNEKNKFFPFQQTMHRRRKHGIDAASKEFPMNVFVFDVLYIDGRDMTEKSYLERREIIEELFVSNVLRPSQMKLVSKTNELEKIFQKSISQGLEGIIAKDLGAPYTAGKRKFAWIKLKKSYGKAVDTIDAVIVGYYLGQGTRAEFEFGGVLVAVYNSDRGKLETVARIGSGFSEEEMKNFSEMLGEIKTKKPPATLDYSVEKPDFWVEPKFVVEVAFDDITKSSMHTCGAKGGTDEKGFALRFPRLVKLREDKTIKEITITEEVIRMYELQAGK
ncbi:MAG: ATP-dependent DNA ligase [Candidatus Micrarchaeota archaeon]